VGLVRFGSTPARWSWRKLQHAGRLSARRNYRTGNRARYAGARTVRKPALLRQVFAVAAGSPAQIISLQKMQGQLQDSGALETVAHYLALLQDAT